MVEEKAGWRLEMGEAVEQKLGEKSWVMAGEPGQGAGGSQGTAGREAS